MATNMYLEIDGIKGESTDKTNKDKIEVMSWSHSFNQPQSPVRSTAGGGTVERANHSDFNFTKYLDIATPELLKHNWRGDHIKKATLTCYRDGGKGGVVAYLKVTMDEVIISNVAISGGAGDIPVENISLSYGKVTYEYDPQDEKSGKKAGAKPASHDLKTNEIA